MEKKLDSEVSSDEKLAVARDSTNAILQYIGTQKSFQEKQDRGLMYMKWMLIAILMLFAAYVAEKVYQDINPPSTEIDRKWITQQQRDIVTQQQYIAVQQKLINQDKAKNVSDALINLSEQKALAVDRADITISRAQLSEIQKNSIRRDSLFNQKKTLNVKTVHADKVDVVNTKSVNINK